MNKISTNKYLYRLGTATRNFFGDRDFLCIDAVHTQKINHPSLGFNFIGKSNQGSTTTPTSLYFLSKEDANDFATSTGINKQYSPISYNQSPQYLFYGVIEFKPGKFVYVLQSGAERLAAKYPHLGIDLDSLQNLPVTKLMDANIVSEKAIMDKAFVTLTETLAKKLSAVGFEVDIEGDYARIEPTKIHANFKYQSATKDLVADVDLTYELSTYCTATSTSVDVHMYSFSNTNCALTIKTKKGSTFDAQKSDNLVDSIKMAIEYVGLSILDPFAKCAGGKILDSGSRFQINFPLHYSGFPGLLNYTFSQCFRNAQTVNKQIDKKIDIFVDYFLDIKDKTIDALNALSTFIAEDIDDDYDIAYMDL